MYASTSRTSEWCPAQGHGRWGGGPASALAEAVALVERATDALRASGDVEWQARAAQLYRVAVTEALQALGRDRELVDVAVRHAVAAQTAVLPSPGGPAPEPEPGAGGSGPVGVRPW
ncbi:hypothetical protein [Promicromonospora aerolata]|uniref:ANTAR domain-containing protein n=1 Tax=Promicromonospora aerolata TaxID=195749 RepID=A0ABW4VB81_9MICO